MTDDRRAVLESIAFGPDATPGERLKALEMLGGGPQADNRAVFDLSGLSGKALDRELAGFFNPGVPPPGPGRRESVARQERRASREVLRKARRLVKEYEQRVAADARRLAEQMVAEGKVVPLRPAEQAEASDGREAWPPSDDAQPVLPPPGVFPDEIPAERYKAMRRAKGENPWS
jgi:hypothetical protein